MGGVDPAASDAGRRNGGFHLAGKAFEVALVARGEAPRVVHREVHHRVGIAVGEVAGDGPPAGLKRRVGGDAEAGVPAGGERRHHARDVGPVGSEPSWAHQPGQVERRVLAAEPALERRLRGGVGVLGPHHLRVRPCPGVAKRLELVPTDRRDLDGAATWSPPHGAGLGHHQRDPRHQPPRHRPGRGEQPRQLRPVELHLDEVGDLTVVRVGLGPGADHLPGVEFGHAAGPVHVHGHLGVERAAVIGHGDRHLHRRLRGCPPRERHVEGSGDPGSRVRQEDVAVEYRGLGGDRFTEAGHDVAVVEGRTGHRRQRAGHQPTPHRVSCRSSPSGISAACV